MIILYKSGKIKHFKDSNNIKNIITNDVKYIMLYIGVDNSPRYLILEPKNIIKELKYCKLTYSISSWLYYMDLYMNSPDDEWDYKPLPIIDKKSIKIKTIEKFYSYLYSFTNIDTYNYLGSFTEFASISPIAVTYFNLIIKSDLLNEKIKYKYKEDDGLDLTVNENIFNEIKYMNINKVTVNLREKHKLLFIDATKKEWVIKDESFIYKTDINSFNYIGIIDEITYSINIIPKDWYILIKKIKDFSLSIIIPTTDNEILFRNEDDINKYDPEKLIDYVLNNGGDLLSLEVFKSFDSGSTYYLINLCQHLIRIMQLYNSGIYGGCFNCEDRNIINELVIISICLYYNDMGESKNIDINLINDKTFNFNTLINEWIKRA